MHVSVCLSASFSTCMSLSVSVCQSVRLSVHPSSVHPSVCLPISLLILLHRNQKTQSLSLSDLESLSPSVSLIHITCTCTQLSFFTFKVVVPRRIQLNIKLMDGCNFRPILCHSLALFILEKKRKWMQIFLVKNILSINSKMNSSNFSHLLLAKCSKIKFF